MRKPFPSKVRWLAVWRHRWLILDLINQIAYGGWADAVHLGAHYGASRSWCLRLHDAALEIIVVEDKNK